MGAAMQLVLPVLVLAAPGCEEYCREPCGDLNGDPAQECALCKGAAYSCQPGAADFGIKDITRHSSVSATGEVAPIQILDALPGAKVLDGSSHIDLLWASPVYSADLAADLGELHASLAAVVSERWEQLASELPAGTDPSSMNEAFHDGHRPELDHALLEFYACGVRGPTLAEARGCEERVATASVWPQLLNHSGFRALFAGGTGLVWHHLQRFAQQLHLSAGGGQPVGTIQLKSWSTWATYHHRGIYHGEHGHTGSQISGVYYVQSPDAGEAAAGGGLLRLFDPRLSALRAMYEPLTRRGGSQVPRTTRSFLPEPGRLLLWPSYLTHEVTPTRGERARVSFPFDLQIENDVVDESGGQLEVHGTVPRASPSDDGVGDVPPVTLEARWAGRR